MSSDILIVDDEKDIRDLIAGVLEDNDYAPRCAHDSDTALAEITARCPSLVLLDVWLTGSRLDGLEMLKILRERYSDLPIIVISGHGNIETAVSALKAGAYDYIEKPFKADKLLATISRAVETADLRRENQELRRRAGVLYEFVGTSAPTERLNSAIAKIAPTNSRVWITGQVGSGKELVARLIHAQSPRAKHAFVAINTAVLDPASMEVFLFGRETKDGIETGVFERAHGGTLYLDEVGDMPLETQAKILRVLVDQRFTRANSKAEVCVDVRVISSSSLEPEQLVSKGELRKDLFHRLSVVPLKVPSLKERRNDIPKLVEHFIEQITVQIDLRPQRMSADAMAVLQSHEWPGNVRQLRNTIEHILINVSRHNRDDISIEALPADILSDTNLNGVQANANHVMTMPLKDAREMFEREYLNAQIGRFSGNISKTAEFIGMERSALHRKLKSLGVHGERVRHVET